MLYLLLNIFYVSSHFVKHFLVICLWFKTPAAILQLCFMLFFFFSSFLLLTISFSCSSADEQFRWNAQGKVHHEFSLSLAVMYSAWLTNTHTCCSAMYVEVLLHELTAHYYGGFFFNSNVDWSYILVWAGCEILDRSKRKYLQQILQTICNTSWGIWRIRFIAQTPTRPVPPHVWLTH